MWVWTAVDAPAPPAGASAAVRSASLVATAVDDAAEPKGDRLVPADVGERKAKARIELPGEARRVVRETNAAPHAAQMRVRAVAGSHEGTQRGGEPGTPVAAPPSRERDRLVRLAGRLRHDAVDRAVGGTTMRVANG